jgi:hypothetical protein
MTQNPAAWGRVRGMNGPFAVSTRSIPTTFAHEEGQMSMPDINGCKVLRFGLVFSHGLEVTETTASFASTVAPPLLLRSSTLHRSLRSAHASPLRGLHA